MNRIGISFITVACIIGIIASAWGYVISRTNSGSWLASSLPWPIACNIHGCVTSSQWATQRSYDIAFAHQTGKTFPSEATTLTTLLRRHLITHASLQSPISPQDAVRYRTAILHTTDIASVKPLGISSFTKYDTSIILPFLQQEALLKQTSISDTDTLYKNLAQQHPIVLLLFQYHWNTDRGEIE